MLIPFPGLLKELTAFIGRTDAKMKGQQAFRLYVRCLRSKPALAERIQAKYGHLFPKGDDTTVAIGYALLATKGGDIDFDL